MEKRKINGYLVAIIIVMAVISSSIILINFLNKGDEVAKGSKDDIKDSVNNYYNYDYKYILSYDYLTVNHFIYLLENDEIKVVSKENVYEICPGENCIKDTGEVKYAEIAVNLNEKAMIKARNVISSFFIKGDAREIDLMSYKTIDSKVRLVLDGIIESNSDKINLLDDIKIEEKTENIKDSQGELRFTHAYNYIADSDNTIVKNIANNINKTIIDEFNDTVEYSKDFLEEKRDYGPFGVSYKLNIELIDDDEISISYITSGSLGGVLWLGERGYVYSINDGKIKEYNNSKKETAYKSALEKFKESEQYKSARDQLLINYEDILKAELFKSGNYYTTESNVVFVIDGYLLGFDEATAKVIEITIPKDKNY